MTDNEIIKGYCERKLCQPAQDIINRLQADKEALIAGQETLQKALAEKYAENEKLTYCKFCEHYELMTSTNQHFCNKYGGYVTETDCCSRGNCKRNGG